MDGLAWLSTLNYGSVFVRLALAFLAGAILGGERGQKGRPAGLRTYTLVCLGSTLAAITNLYIHKYHGGDPTRIAAQVLSGIGFLGAGTILVTRMHQVRGLTTAAGLWCSGSIGIALGAGFYWAAALGFAFALFALHTMSKIDHRIIDHSGRVTLYVELEKTGHLGGLISKLRSYDIRVDIIDTTKIKDLSTASLAVTLYLVASKEMVNSDIIEMVSSVEGVSYLEELR